MTTGTTSIATHIVAGAAIESSFFARGAVGITTTQFRETDPFERVQFLQRELRGAANFIARSATGNFFARGATSNFVARSASGRCKQASQFSAQFGAGCIASEFIARIASGFFARIACKNGIAGAFAATAQTDTVH
jgi:hypothetical protein